MLPWLALYFPKYGTLNVHIQASGFKLDITLSFKSLKTGVYKNNNKDLEQQYLTVPSKCNLTAIV